MIYFIKTVYMNLGLLEIHYHPITITHFTLLSPLRISALLRYIAIYKILLL